MPTNKAAELIAELGAVLQGIDGTGEYFNTVVPNGIMYGIETFNEMGFTPETDYPRITIIANDLTVTDFSTKSCARTEIEIIIHGYLWKGAALETGIASYTDTLNWSKDLRTAFRNYLNSQAVSNVDSDLYTNSINQSIAYAQNYITASLTATLLFDEKLGD
jgi:hypothetical protein